MSARGLVWFSCFLLAWHQVNTLVLGSGSLLNLFQPWLSAAMQAKKHMNSPPEVKHLTAASYEGLNYVMVKNLSLSFVQAERYCANEFSEPMHLASVRSENEWQMLAEVFGTSYPSEVWLGGIVQRSNSHVFILHWLDSLQFVYHRFPGSERKRWMANWRVSSQGCITANLQSNAQGNWSAELTPCSGPRPFICKEVRRPMDSPQEFSDEKNLLTSILFPSPMIPFDMLRDLIRYRLSTINQTTVAPSTVTTTPAPTDQTTSSSIEETTIETEATTENPETELRLGDTTSEAAQNGTELNPTISNTKLLASGDEDHDSPLQIPLQPPPEFTIHPKAPREENRAASTDVQRPDMTLSESTAQQTDEPSTVTADPTVQAEELTTENV